MSDDAQTGITRRIARFVSETGFDALPNDVVELAKRCIVDGMAVILAGTREDCARIARDYVTLAGGAPEATVLGEPAIRAPLHLAAFANGIAGHALDWDDTALSLEQDRSVLIHPTMQPLCAGLAAAEHTGASGREFLAAFVLGFEVQVRIAEAIHPDHFSGGRGFHSSGTIGVFGAAVAVGKLLGLTETQMRNAIAIAATMAAGIGANHGTMAKPLNMGRAAESGATAARLASLGFDGPANALEGGRGFFEAFGGGFENDRIAGRLGAPFALIEPGTSVKPYPSGVVGHPGMDAMKALVTEYDIAPEEVERVVVRTGPNVIAPGPLRIAHAKTGLEGKFCIPFQMAAMILRRKAGRKEFSDAFAASEACQALQRKVTAELSPEIAAMGKDKVVCDIMLTTTDGRTLTRRSEPHYRGGPKNPLSWEALCDKFRDCAAGVIDEASEERFLTSVRSLDAADGVSGLVRAVSAGG